MKKRLIKHLKRISVFALVLLITLSLTACDSFEQRLKGFTEAMTFMAGEPNLSSSAEITIRLSDDAVSVSFADFIAAVTDIEAIEKMEIRVAVESRVYGDSMKTSIYWINSESAREEILSMTYIGDALYVSTAILKTIEAVVGADEELTELLGMIGDADYLHIQVPAMVSLADLYAHGDIAARLENFDVAEMTSALRGGMSSALESAVEQALTKEFDEALQEKDGEYILTLNTQLAIEFAQALLQLVVAHEEDIIEYTANIVESFFGEEISAEQRENERGLWQAAASEALAFINSDEFMDRVPAINFEYRVKATGEGQQKAQTSSTWLEIPANEQLPFQRLELSITQATTIHSTPITVPQGRVVSFEELMGITVMHHFEGWGELPDNFDLEQAIADVDLGQIASDFGIDLSQFGIDVDDINMSQVEGLINSFDFGSFFGR